MRKLLRRKDNRVTDEPGPGAADDATAAGTTLGELEQRLNRLQQDLTGRLNQLNSLLTEQIGEANTTAGKANNTANALRGKVTNNENSIASFQGRLDSLTTDVAQTKSAVQVLADRIGHLEDWQGALNTAFTQAIQQNRDFTLDQYRAATGYVDQVAAKLDGQLTAAKTELTQAIQAVTDAPVKPHTHTVHLAGETENPTVDTVGRAA
jgi:chromosome segregation ATPase